LNLLGDPNQPYKEEEQEIRKYEDIIRICNAEIPQGRTATLLAIIESSRGLQPTLNRRKRIKRQMNTKK